DKDRDARTSSRIPHAPVHTEARGDRRELHGKLTAIEVESVERPLHTHEEHAGNVVLVLVGVQDVCPMLIKKLCDARDQTAPVGTIDKKNGCILQKQCLRKGILL